MSKPTTITREELYEQVWTEAVYKVANRYGLSGAGLAKICKRHKIPTPDRGYWAKKQFGKKVRKKRLPKADAELETIVIHSSGHEPSAGLGEASEPPIPFPDRVRITHPLVKKSKALLTADAGGRFGILSPPEGCLDIQVGKKQLRRALRIVQVLVTELEARGWDVEISGRTTRVSVDGEWVHFGIEEPRRQVLKPSKWNPDYSFREVEPSGRLELKIRSYGAGHRRTWADAKKQRVENCLASFIKGLRAIAPYIREHRIALEERQRRWEEEARRRREEQKRLSNLRTWADQWHEARRLRQFVDAAKEKLARRNGGELSDYWVEWFRWADDYVDSQDPLVLSDDEDNT